MPATQIQKLTTKLPWEILGACGEMLQTAYGSLFYALQLKEGETLLIRGGTTSVGLAASAIARNHGVTVVSTTRNAQREELLRSRGANIVVVDGGEIAEDVKKQTDGGVNKVLELIGTTTLLDSLQCCKPQGMVCMTGIVGNSMHSPFSPSLLPAPHPSICQHVPGWTLPSFSPMAAIPTSVGLTAYSGGPEEFMTTPLQEMVEQIEAGKLEITVGKTFKLDEIVEAHRVMEENGAGGKIVVLT